MSCYSKVVLLSCPVINMIHRGKLCASLTFYSVIVIQRKLLGYPAERGGGSNRGVIGPKASSRPMGLVGSVGVAIAGRYGYVPQNHSYE